MPIAVGRLVAIALGYFGPVRDVRGINAVPDNGLPDDFLENFIPQPAIDGYPPLVGFRRPQHADRTKRDCLSNGTNYCFGESNTYCSLCGSCCMNPGNSNNKWCCPSGTTCCGSACCSSGQTCNNGQCYYPVQTITATSVIAVTSTHFVSSLTTVYQRVLESSVIKSIIDVTNTNAETQTNWVYVTTTAIGKRAEPTALPLQNVAGNSSTTELDGLGIPDVTSGHGGNSNAGAISLVATTPLGLTTTAPGLTTTTALPLAVQTTVIQSTVPDAPFIAPVPNTPTEPTASTEEIDPREPQAVAETTAATMSGIHSTSTIVHAMTVTSIITRVISSTTTVVTTSTNIQTITQTNTVVLNAKTTVEATSTWTYTSHHPVTVTMTEIATYHQSNTGSSTATTAPPALVTSSNESLMPHKGLSSSAIAGIGIAATIGTIALGFAIFYVVRIRMNRAKERKAATEDYAFLGTGRSDFDGPDRSNSGSKKAPPMIMHSRQYSGPPPPGARRPSVRTPAVSHVDPMQNQLGLPSVPWYSVTSKTSPPTSPVSPTSNGHAFFSDNSEQSISPMSPTYNRAMHIRSGSTQTTGTAGSSTVVGGSSNRNSVRSNSGKTVRFQNGAIPHKRASSSGSGTTEALYESADETPASQNATEYTPPIAQASPTPPTAPVAPSAPIVQFAPVELSGVPSRREYLSPDPPSPMLQPQLGPLRIVNIPPEADEQFDRK